MSEQRTEEQPKTAIHYLAEIDNLRGELEAARRQLAETAKRLLAATARLNAHRRFHDKVGCPGGDDCYVCRVDDDTTYPTDKWDEFPRLAQATTEARLRAEKAEAENERLRADLDDLRDLAYNRAPQIAAEEAGKRIVELEAENARLRAALKESE